MTGRASTSAMPAARPQRSRWRLQDAKARFTELVRMAHGDRLQHVTLHGRDAVAVVDADEFNRLKGVRSGELLSMRRAGTRWDRAAGERRHPRRCPMWTTLLGQTTLVLCALASCPGAAASLDVLSVGVRGRVGEKRVLGQEAPESFRAYDLVASFRLPWQRYSSSDWGVGTRLLTSAGVLQGAGKTALVVSAIPALAFGSRDGRFTLDFGAGLALVSEHRFAQQDFGGPLQGALTFGVSAPLYRQLAVGYRFQHYSDAGAYGAGSIGVDFHMLEFSYRF